MARTGKAKEKAREVLLSKVVGLSVEKRVKELCGSLADWLAYYVQYKQIEQWTTNIGHRGHAYFVKRKKKENDSEIRRKRMMTIEDLYALKEMGYSWFTDEQLEAALKKLQDEAKTDDTVGKDFTARLM